MHPWFSVYAQTNEFGTYASVSFYVTDEDGKHVKQWDHEVRLSQVTDVPEDEIEQWSSMLARAVSRYFEDRVIEHIRSSVGKPNVADTQAT